MSELTERIEKALEANEMAAKPLTLTALASQIEVKFPTLYATYRKRKDRIEGLAKKKRAEVRAVTTDPTTLEGRLNWLKEIVEGASEGTKVRALEFLHEISNQLGHGVGPGDPLTREDRISRLKVILEACEPDEVKEALKECSL